jgi:site-specific DNA recombinase
MTNKEVGTKYILYARKSTESDDKQAASIESQLNEMVPIAKKKGVYIKDIIKEACSGYKGGRKGFQQLIQRIEKGEIDGIVCWSLSRLARNPLDAGQIMQSLLTGKIKHIITFKKDYYPTDQSMLLYVEFGINNQYSQDLSVDTLRGLRQKAGRGWNPQSTLPLGYIHNPNEKLRKFSDEEIIREPEKFELVKMLFREILDNGLTPSESIEKVRKLGLTTRRGNKPSDSVMYRIVNDTFYYGEFTYPKDKEVYMGKHEKMITKKEFETIQKILHRKNPSKVKRHKHKYTGLLTCSNCGCAITGDPVRSKLLKSGKTAWYKYYHCTKKKGDCEGKYATEELIETQIKTDLKRFFIPPEILAIIQDEIERETSKDSEKAQKGMILGQKEIDKIQVRKDKLLDLFIDGKIAEKVYKRKKKALDKEVLEIEEIISHKDDEVEVDLPPSVDLEKYDTLNNKVRKKLLKDVYKQMSYSDGEIELQHFELLDVFYNVPSEITNEYYEVRTDKNVDMKEFVETRIEESSIWGGRWDLNPQPSVPQTDALTS